MANDKHDEFEVTERRAKVSSLYKQGLSYRQISMQIDVSYVTIGNDINFMIQEWRKEYLGNISDQKVVELAKLNETEKEAWSEWYRSKNSIKETTEEDCETPKGPMLRSRTKITGRIADKGLLMVILQCIRMRCEIFGIIGPNRVDDVIESPVEEVIVSTREEAKRLDEFLANQQ